MDPPPPPPPPVVVTTHRPGDEQDGNRYERRQDIVHLNPLVVALHKCPESMITKVCALLAEKWPKADHVRTMQLRSSCDAFPLSLVMVSKEDPDSPIGHAMLSRCVEDAEGILAESVLVTDRLRGMGYGRSLMLMMHDFVRQHGFKRVYLSTRDKRDFYMHLGYTVGVCVTPISTASERFGSDTMNAVKNAFGGAAASGAGGPYVWLKLEL